MGAADLLEEGIVDRIFPELPGAAEEPVAFCRRLGAVLRYELGLLAASRVPYRTQHMRRYDGVQRDLVAL